MLILVEGPAGSGKSQLAGEMLSSGEVQILADTTALWAAVGGHERDPATGKYPVRSADDPALHAARYLQTTTVAFGLREGFNTVVTTSQRGQAGRWAAMAAEHGATFSVRTIDMDEQSVIARLADPETGILDPECEAAIGIWFK